MPTKSSSPIVKAVKKVDENIIYGKIIKSDKILPLKDVESLERGICIVGKIITTGWYRAGRTGAGSIGNAA